MNHVIARPALLALLIATLNLGPVHAAVQVILGPTPIADGEAAATHDITVMNEKLAFALAVESPVPYGVPRGDLSPVVAAEIERGHLPAGSLRGSVLAREGRPAEDKPDAEQALLPFPRQVVVPKLRALLTVDGNLNEPVWTSAALLSPFVLNDGSGPELERSAVRLWYDDTALYLGWTCTDADIQATLTARDSKFWEEEVAEFFVTAGSLERYFELQWNPLGGVFDAIISNKLDQHGVSMSITGDWSFTAKRMRSAVTLKGTAGNSDDKDEMWQAEVIIPFVDLGEDTPKPRTVWRANFYRFNRAKGQPPELLSWSATLLPGFHQPARFGYLEFGE